MDLIRPLVEVLLAAWPLPRTWLTVDDVEQWLNRLPKPMALLIVAIARRLEAGESLPMRADIEQAVREELVAAGRETELDPMVIVLIVELILHVIQWWRNRK